MVVKVYVNAYKAEQKLKLLQAKLKSGAKLTVLELGNMGKAYAQSHAPVSSGRLISLIRVDKINDGSGAIIRSVNPTLNDGHKRGYYGGPVPFDLVKWMHLTRGKWKSGPLAGRQASFSGKDPRYMYRTTEYLQRVAKRTAENNLKGKGNNIIIR